MENHGKMQALDNKLVQLQTAFGVSSVQVEDDDFVKRIK